VGDIIVQLDVFVEQQECDEAQSLQAPDGINLNSHLDVFYAILRQVSAEPTGATERMRYVDLTGIATRVTYTQGGRWDLTKAMTMRVDQGHMLIMTTRKFEFTCTNTKKFLGEPTFKNLKNIKKL